MSISVNRFEITFDTYDKIRFTKYDFFSIAITVKLTSADIDKFIDTITKMNEYGSSLINIKDSKENNFNIRYNRSRNCCVIKCYSSDEGPSRFWGNKSNNSINYNVSYDIENEIMIAELNKIKNII